jgi:riboflavin kinase / FMN adenylyltransferase
VQLIRHPTDLQKSSRKICAAIGMFDGVHLGHQQVLRQAVADAQQHNGTAVAVTFDRHPASVVAPERAPQLIYTLNQKLRALETTGIDAVLLLEFNAEFSRKTGEEFVREIVKGFGAVYSICVGSTFHFGHKRSGNVELLKQLGLELNFLVHGIAAVSLGGRVVSSTRIRELISFGALDQASQCLGRAYAISGRVERGDQLGRRLGFPTANINVAGLVVPPFGVYAVRARLKGELIAGVTNIGVRPTIGKAEPELRVETHLLEFNREIYDQELELCFVERIRAEQKFQSVEDLRQQISRDVAQAREILG